MTYQIIPVQPVPNQQFQVELDDATAQITLTTTDYGMLADVVYNGVAVALSRLCLDRTDLNPAAYQGMPQGLYFVDMQGTSAPVYTGLNTRYLLLYGDPLANGGTLVPSNTAAEATMAATA